jgi:hypothetical protein
MCGVLFDLDMMMGYCAKASKGRHCQMNAGLPHPNAADAARLGGTKRTLITS